MSRNPQRALPLVWRILDEVAGQAERQNYAAPAAHGPKGPSANRGGANLGEQDNLSAEGKAAGSVRGLRPSQKAACVYPRVCASLKGTAQNQTTARADELLPSARLSPLQRIALRFQ